jgi:hypothetical protein
MNFRYLQTWHMRVSPSRIHKDDGSAFRLGGILYPFGVVSASGSFDAIVFTGSCSLSHLCVVFAQPVEMAPQRIDQPDFAIIDELGLVRYCGIRAPF